MRDALVAALTLNIFNNHCDKVVMANIAQLVNNLHSLFLSSDDQCIKTPNYHVFDLFTPHHGAVGLRSVVASGALPDAASADRETESGGSDQKASAADGRLPHGASLVSCAASLKDKSLTVTLANLRYDEPVEVRLVFRGVSASGRGTMSLLAAADPHHHNTFENPDVVTVRRGNIDLVEGSLTSSGDTVDLTLPAASVAAMELGLR
jgi:alpha-N-arabinofuranosidase